ncbi:MAG: alpha-amylase, partial [Solirubrobacterales bacterium]|nr:alpha-amylase [Solirubrobacterales bacterium]
QALIERGVRLILDFVPNHVAPDHPWVESHPEYFIQGNESELSTDPGPFIRINDKIFAFGRDPFFPAWTDVLQLNTFDAGLRAAVIDTLTTIGAQCDGVRCDMAMLLLNHVFERTWSGRAGKKPATEYWSEVISGVHETHPEMLFMAEAYWDLEWDLQRLGFDYCYDKRLYDRLKHDTPEGVRQHLRADLGYQEKLVRFLENHDEPRAAATFAPEQQRVVAIATFTQPGARFFHEGQFEGRKVRPPVQLRRRPQEAVDTNLQDFYRTLLQELNSPALRKGKWRLLERTGWPDNASYLNLVAWSWRHQDDRVVIVVNLSDTEAQGQIQLPWDDLRGQT